jgi:AsmA protein
MKRWFAWPRVVLYSLFAVGLAAWYVPKISAERFREPIHSALERALGRNVTIGEVGFQLLPLPGFTVTDVVVGEDPSIGPEPAAYIGVLLARPKISALVGGPLEFASVDLETAYINLTRVETSATGVRWNFASLTRSRLPSSFPSVHLISGRVNFKFGDTKSIFYLQDTDIDLWPPSGAGGLWDLRIHAQPARTDRPARGFGSFVARGQWRPSNGNLTLDVQLEKSELGDMVTLFEGRETGLLGHIRGDAHLAGPVNRVGIAARLYVDDIHGWNQTPPGGSAWPLAIGGFIDVPGQTFEIRATTTGRQSPIDVRYRVTDYLARPRWAVNAIFSRLPMSPLVTTARNLGLPIPPDMNYEGTAEGAVGCSMPATPGDPPRWDGEIRIADSTLAVGNTPPLRAANADLRFEGAGITLSPTVVENDAHESATLSGSFDLAANHLEASLSTEGMSIASLRRQTSIAGVPILSQASSGTWSGLLRFSNTEPMWTGDVRLADTDIPFEALAKPLHITTADASINGAAIVVKHFVLTAGGIQAQGDYRYEPTLDRPHRFHLSIAPCTGEALQRLLMPTFHRGNFLNYALNLGRVPEPDWLRALHADGTVQISSIDLGPATLSKFRARLLWDAGQVRLSAIQTKVGNAAFTGLATIGLTQRQPFYQASGKLVGLPWRSGFMDADGTLTSSGVGADLVKSLSAKGSFRARDISLPPLDTWDRIDGCFDWSLSKLRLTQLVMTNGDNTWLGAAETQDDGQLALRVSDGSRQIQTALRW